MIDTEFANILAFVTDIYNKGDYEECSRMYDGMIRGVCEYHLQYADITEYQREILESIINNTSSHMWEEFLSHL